MRKLHLVVSSLAVVLFGIMSLGSSPGWATGLNFLKKDQSVCYQLLNGNTPLPEMGFRLNVKKHSPLTTFKEKKQFDHPLQTTYSAMGKSIDAQFLTPSLGGVNGTVTVAKKTGARMVLSWSHQLTPWLGGTLFTATVECSSAEASL